MKHGVSLRVAGAQIEVTDDVARNLENIDRALTFASREGADLLLTPEGSLSGYTHKFDRRAVGLALSEVVQKAAGKGLALALGTCLEEEDGLCYNQVRFYDKGGRFLGFHAKTLRCGSVDEPTAGEIDHYAVKPLRTFDVAGIRVGALICNDLWANPGCTPMPDPHLTQELSRLGSRIIFHAVNGGRDGGAWSRDVAWPYHESNLRMRAQAGRVWIVTADNCSPVTLPCSAPSGVLNPEGNWVVRAPIQGEAFFVHTIELQDRTPSALPQG